MVAGTIGRMSEKTSISAIIPTLNEESCIEACLERLELAGVDELIVVDGGSEDRTRELARGRADKVLLEPGGVFSQMNRGAREAEGEILLFQYADGMLGGDAAAVIRRTLEAPGISGGAFRLSLDRGGVFYRAVCRCAHWRNRLGFGPFGDQSIFVRAGVFSEAGGFPVDGALPDHEFVRILARSRSFRLLEEPVTVSTRRWERCGKLRTLLHHWRISLLYLTGMRRNRSSVSRGADSLRKVR